MDGTVEILKSRRKFNMVNFKKFVAAALAATMVIGGSVTAFATTTTTEGSQDGAGTSEGHVDKNVVDVVLPTTTATTFAYTMDPERLITATSAARFDEGTVFPTQDDTGVYFLTAEKTYANTSNTVQVINKGAVEQKVTIKAKLTAGAKDIAVLSAAPAADATTAGLYLTAKVANVTKALSTSDAEWYLKLPGNDNNYEVAYDTTQTKYVYKKKTSGLAAWKAADISVTGAVTNGIAVESDTTAPQITVSWKFENVPAQNDSTTYESSPTFTDFSDTPAAPANAAPSIATTSYQYTAGQNVEVTVSLGTGNLAATGVTSVTFTNDSGTVTTLPTTRWSYSNGKLVFNDTYTSALNGKTRTHVVTFNDTAGTTVNVTLAPASGG